MDTDMHKWNRKSGNYLTSKKVTKEHWMVKNTYTGEILHIVGYKTIGGATREIITLYRITDGNVILMDEVLSLDIAQSLVEQKFMQKLPQPLK